MLNKVTDDNKGGTDYEMSTYYNGMDFLKENFPTIEEASAGDVYSYKEYLKQWYQNGDPVAARLLLRLQGKKGQPYRYFPEARLAID